MCCLWASNFSRVPFEYHFGRWIGDLVRERDSLLRISMRHALPTSNHFKRKPQDPDLILPASRLSGPASWAASATSQLVFLARATLLYQWRLNAHTLRPTSRCQAISTGYALSFASRNWATCTKKTMLVHSMARPHEIPSICHLPLKTGLR